MALHMAVGVTSLEVYSNTGEIILGLKALCCTVVTPDMYLRFVSKKTCYTEDLFFFFFLANLESAFVPETIAFSSCACDSVTVRHCVGSPVNMVLCLPQGWRREPYGVDALVPSRTWFAASP